MAGINDRWIYTYDYAPESLWEPWRASVFTDGDLKEDGTPVWIDREADTVAARVRGHRTGAATSVQAAGNAFAAEGNCSGCGADMLPAWILLADSHFAFNGTWEDTVASIRALSERIPLAGILHLGDLTDGLLPEKKTREITERVLSDLRAIAESVCVVPGNHDYNYFRGNPEIFYPDTPQFYLDVPGLRFIFIDSFDPKEPVRYGFTEECIHWLDACLSDMPSGSRAVIFSHMPPLVRLQAWTNDLRGRVGLMEVLNRHADRILAFINGHNHCDLLYNDLYNGQFPVISVNCAKCEYFTDHKPEGAVTPPRRLGDRTQESFDVLQIDAAAGILYLTRFGAGEDRIVRNHRAEFCGETGTKCI